MTEKFKYEAPKVKKMEKGEKEAYVFQSFHGLGFKIESEEMMQLYERLIELASIDKSHFNDAVQMAKMVDVIWDNLEQIPQIKFDKNELKLACLFHDIGKSGPANANREQRRLIQMLFNPKFFNPKSPDFAGKGSLKDLTIEQALALETQISDDDKKSILEYLETLDLHIYYPDTEKREAPGSRKPVVEKLDIKKHKMIDFWREHDQWTFDLLTNHKDHLLSDDVIEVASNHHILEGFAPAPIKKMTTPEGTTVEILDKYMMITLIDKYQAWIERSGKGHEAAIKDIERQINESVGLNIISEQTAEQYFYYLRIIADHDKLALIVNQQK